MTQQKKFLWQRIYLPLLISIYIAGVTGGLHLYRKVFLPQGSSYTPLVTVGVDIHTVDEVFYAQRIQRAALGNLLVGDRHFFEYRNTAYIFPTFTPFIFGLITKILGNISWTFILADVLFPPITFLLLYYVIFRGTGNILVSVTGAIAATFYDIFQELIAATLRLSPAYYFERVYVGDGRVLHMTRFEAQEFIFPFILLAVLLLWQSFEKKKPVWAGVSGIIFGLHAYIYPYSTLFYAVGTIILLGYFLINRKLTEAKYILFSFLSAGVVSLPYLKTLFHFTTLPVAADVVRRASVIEDYRLSQFVTQFGHYFIFAAATFYIARGNRFIKYATIYLLGILLLLLIFPYGKVYHLDIYLKIWFPVVLFMFLDEVVKKVHVLRQSIYSRRAYNLLSFLIFLTLFGGGSLKQLSSAIPSRGNFTINQSILDSYEWIKKNTSPDSVILTPSLRTNRELPAYVPNFVFLGRGEFTYAPSREILERALLVYKYFDYSESDVVKVFTGMDKNISIPFKAPYSSETIESLGVYYFLGQSGASEENLQSIFGNSQGLNSLLKVYRQQPQLSLSEIQKKYRADYIYFGPYERGLIQFDSTSEEDLQLVFESEHVKIYQVQTGRLGTQ